MDATEPGLGDTGRDGAHLPEHVRRNRQLWDSRQGAWFGKRARAQWAAEPHWGVWRIPQAELPVFPDDLAGRDLIDLGCGTGYVCAWAARAGARPVGIDNSERQLATARAMQHDFGLEFPLLHGNAERVPYPDASFDIAISEHGAIGWCDPYRWIPEAARLLRPGGELVFVRNSTLLTLCVPESGAAAARLRRPQFGLYRVESEDGTAVNFQLPHGPMVRLLRDSGFVLEDLLEVQAPENASTEYDYVDLEWARQWPSAEVWKARRSPR
ncbi:class I SAM-dependent methyltransferase [Actinopolymorpha pittospori]|uniref:SAM-dependent methyltransferase n=1 Tax=Actinopolymorpha pittospori TaxID=648752 RepID=A0A927RJ45_9ACTN|nr:class I SAM-dependent methyltransferase [Actinopolymorpha pittospori]MBE1605238.1 SAM-dependent methyltransferase [Actinopolymorpha pittospori]